MVDLPISNYVKNYYKERNIILEDFAQATIIWISDLDWCEKIDKLQKIADTTADDALRLQIKERIELELKNQAQFIENLDRKYIYRVTEYDDGSGHCYFSTIDRAIEYGKRECDSAIRIHKIIVDPDDGRDKDSFCMWDMSASKILEFFSYTNDDISEDNTYGKDERFEMAFIHCEFPFERGDIVHHILTDQIGVLATSREDWERHTRQHDSGEFTSDASDIVVSVEYVGDDGQQYYDHMNVLNLEKATEFESQAEKDLMQCMSRVLLGKETLLWNYRYCLDQYVRSK